MKKVGFTLIELLVALAISVAALMTTVYFGHQWWQRQVENQFFADFQRDWAHLRQVALTDGETVNVKWHYDRQEFVFQQIHQGAGVHLRRPPWVRVDYDLYWQLNWTGGNFTSPQTIGFYRANGQHVTFAWQLGTGVLLRHDE